MSDPKTEHEEEEQPLVEEIEEEEEDKEEPIKVNNSNLVELKNACDDYIQKYFNTKTEFIQNHKHTDFKLILGYLSCAFALYGGYYGQVTPFNESKEITFICVVVYFVLNVILVIHTFLFEKDIIFLGEKSTSDTKERLTIHTNTKKYSDIYNVTFEFHENNSSGKPIDGKFKISKSFGNWFDVNGLMNTELFDKELANGLEIARSGKLHLQ
ncbi:microsomal signal peptidase 25 kDa subunit-domain-containing protein [Gigaspora rosea]|uniref:Signal peptidase complex subunit 2 n=1 Tax=Gigaspora rosea TaxID=44941 RepID=A0A397V3K7_9GLOM|nr:microsomal signal peptidase 25 kDa subunit-domain-containing protein [Gigaspora rosea]